MAHEFEIVWTSLAITEVKDIVEYIARDSYHYAELVEDRIYEVAESLSRFPLRNRIVPEFDNENVREILVHSYRVIYFATETKVTILSVIHSARDLKKLGN